uniref:Virion structural protein n=1 Tax=Pseudomonas phage RVTF4 TaxID=3236931 RepID=A0AB39CCP7_9VIRU
MVTLPYLTTLGRLSKTEPYVAAIRKAEVTLSLPPMQTVMNETIQMTGVVTPREEHDDVPNFAHIVNVGDDRSPKLVVDGRQYMKYDERTGVTRLTAANDWQLQCVRVALTLKMLEEGPSSMSRFTDFPAKLFMDWVTGTLVQRYTLPPQSEMALRVISCLYYFSLYMPELAKAGHDRLRAGSLISDLTRVPLDDVLFMVDPDVKGSIGDMENADQFANELSSKGKSLAMGKLGFSDLHVLLKASWFGLNSSDNVGMALEHLPTWLAIAYTACSDRSYRKSKITERAERLSTGNAMRNFIDLVGRAAKEQFV